MLGGLSISSQIQTVCMEPREENNQLIPTCVPSPYHVHARRPCHTSYTVLTPYMSMQARPMSVDEVTVVVNYLEEFGFSRDELIQLILAFPQILSYSVEERIQDLLEYLVSDEIGCSIEQVRTMISKRPTIIGLQRSQVEQMIGFLLNNGSTQEEVVAMLESSL